MQQVMFPDFYGEKLLSGMLGTGYTIKERKKEEKQANFMVGISCNCQALMYE